MREVDHIYFWDRDNMFICRFRGDNKFDLLLVVQSKLRREHDRELYDVIYNYYRANVDIPYISTSWVTASLLTSDFRGVGCRLIASGRMVGHACMIMRRIYEKYTVSDALSALKGEVYEP